MSVFVPILQIFTSTSSFACYLDYTGVEIYQGSEIPVITRKFEMRTSCMQEQLPNPLSHEIQRKALHFFLATLELTHFNPVSHFYTPRKRQKTKVKSLLGL